MLLACIGVALVLGAVARSEAGPAAPSFAVAKNYATGEGPDSLAIADLNGDSKPDLVTANSGNSANTVSVLLNRGQGSFEPKRNYLTGGVDQLAIADLNGDSKPDLVTANFAAHTSSVSVLLNGSDGSFEAKHDYATGRAPHSLAIGDLNGDGKPDLVTANFDAATLSVLLNRGDGGFEAKRDYPTGDEPDSLAIGNLNGDGKPDLAVANANTLSVLLNRGDGSFDAKHDYPTGAGFLTLADVNGDGKPDILFVSDTPVPSLSVLLNNGDGSFQAGHYYETCWPCFGTSQGSEVRSLAIADLNGDGKPDVATRVVYDLSNQNYQGTVSVFLNKGDGSFKERSYRTGWTDFYGANQLVASDLNGDGKPDLATAVDRLSVLVNRGDGSFQAKVEYPGGRLTSDDFGGGPVASADLNGDAKPDLVTTGHSSVEVLINTPGLCNVQGVVRMTPAAAKRQLARVNCRVGKVGRAYSKRVKRGRVISEKPKFGAVLPQGGKVNLVVSRGRRH